MFNIADTLLSASKAFSVDLDNLLAHPLAQDFVFCSKGKELFTVWFFERVELFLITHLDSQPTHILPWHPFVSFCWDFQRDKLQFVELLVDYLRIDLFACYAEILQKVLFGILWIFLAYNNSFFGFHVLFDANINNAASGI